MIAAAALALLCSWGHAHSGEQDLLGITARWESPSEQTTRQLRGEMARLALEASEQYDPDCLFRKPNALGICANRFEKAAAALSEASALYREETLGFFDIHHRQQSPPKRDFGGVWQGDAIDAMKSLLNGDFIVDFSGDIFLTSPRATDRELIVTDPVLDVLKYATVRLNRGFMVASVSRRMGGKVRVPDALQNVKPEGEILKAVLFAEPQFSGARLDAWSTAVVAGGTKVLRHLESLEKFQGQWEYFYFEPDGTPHFSQTSQRLKVESTGFEREITVTF